MVTLCCLLFSPSLLQFYYFLVLFFFLPCSLICCPSLDFFKFYFSMVPPLLPCLCTLRVSEPMVVCTAHPPASHSAPSFLRQYAGHLGRTALRRELGGGIERDRAYLNLHRTGSLGTNAHTQTPYFLYVTTCERIQTL